VSALILLSSNCSDDDKGSDPTNRAPQITSIVADPDTFLAEHFTTVTVEATDPDGDELDYAWDRSQEWLSPLPSQGNSVQLTNCCVVDEMKCAWIIGIVTDGRGGEARDSVKVCCLPTTK
jgi:hypothetical protein